MGFMCYITFKCELQNAKYNVLTLIYALVYSIIPSGSGNKYSIPMNLSLWGLIENKQKVDQVLKRYGVWLTALPPSLRYVKEKSTQPRL